MKENTNKIWVSIEYLRPQLGPCVFRADASKGVLPNIGYTVGNPSNIEFDRHEGIWSINGFKITHWSYIQEPSDDNTYVNRHKFDPAYLEFRDKTPTEDIPEGMSIECEDCKIKLRGAIENPICPGVNYGNY